MHKISLAVSQFYPELSLILKSGAMEELQKQGVQDIDFIEVPGSKELPIAAQWLFQKGAHAVIALGVLIQGETDHYLDCCQTVTKGSLCVQLKFNRPLICAVLMVKNKQQALERLGGKKGHAGKEAVVCALKMLKTRKAFHLDNLN